MKLFLPLALFLAISASLLSGQSPSKGFYVAPNGNDSNPGTLERPFATLTKAQSAMRASSSVKTTYVRAGVYKPEPVAKASCMNGDKSSASVDLRGLDAGETWSYYPPDGYNSAILDGQSTEGNSARAGGNGTGCAFSGYKLSNIQIIGLQFQNYLYSAFWVNTGTQLVFNENIVHHLTAAAWGAGAVSAVCAPGTIVKNNYIYDVAYTGTELQTRADCSGGISGDVVSGNIIENSCTWPATPGYGNDQNGGDCGAIYFDDKISPASTEIQVVNNYVRDVNISSRGAGNNGKNGKGGCCAIGVYLDDGTSNVTVTGNVIGGIASACFHLHGGDNNSIKNNICDLANSDYQSIAVYQQSKAQHEMAGNSFTNNIVVSGSRSGGSGFAGYQSPPNPLAISSNLYFNCSGGSKLKSSGTSGAGNDSSPLFENPHLSGWTYDISDESSTSKISFEKIEGNWGPPGLTLPQQGTPPSCSH
jgi:hypothetical protein